MHIRIRNWVKITFFIIIVISSLILYSRYIGTKGIIIKEYSIINKNIPESFYGFKIVQISDIHYNVTTDYSDLEKMIKEINILKPDIVIFNGDLFDKNVEYTTKDYDDLKNILKSINYNIGKYAIKGENDLNNDHWNEIITSSDFKDINDNIEYIYSEGIDPIAIIGISSNYNENHIEDTINNIKLDNIKYNILVLHEPDFIDNIDINKFNLVLAGHSLGGQIYIPYYGGLLKNKFATKYSENYYKINDSDIYISSGIGTSKYKFRFLNKPSINFYRLRNK